MIDLESELHLFGIHDVFTPNRQRARKTRALARDFWRKQEDETENP